MPEVFSFTHLADGQRIFLGKAKVGSSERDDSGYQYFDVYDDEYLENQLGCLGICVSGTVSGMWGFGEEGDARKKLAEVMRLAFPFINLPISPGQYSSIPSGYFPMVELFSEGDTFYDEKNRTVHMPSGANPEGFFKSTIFSGKMDEDKVKTVVLLHGYLEGLNDNSGSFRFLSIEITKQIWPINPMRVTKAYYGLVEDGYLEPMGGKTSSGFPSFTRVPSAARRVIENVGALAETTESRSDSVSAEKTATPPYVADTIKEKLAQSAKDRGYDTNKLEAILSELNDAVERSKAQSSHALIRALLDHIAPLFDYSTFAQVANNYAWTQTDKKRIEQLNTLFRFDADESLHSPISKRNTAVDMHSIGLIRRTINVVLEEAIDQEPGRASLSA